MTYLVTKKQVEGMYSEFVKRYTNNKRNIVLTLYRGSNNKVEWTLDNDFTGLKIYTIEDIENGLFEWVKLKEIGGRRSYTKKELIDGIQWNLTNNHHVKQGF